MTEKVINFASSESNSSSESESPLAAADEYESGEYGAFKDDFDSGVNNFRPISPLRSSLHKNCGGASYGDAIVSLINREMKEHFNHVLRAAHGINAQIIQLESRTRQLQGLIDNLKDSTEFYHRRTERRLGEVEDKMTEVQGGIQDLRDKQKIAEVQLQLVNLQQIRANSQSKHQNSNAQNKSSQQQVSYANQQDHLPHPSPASCQQKPYDLHSYNPSSPVQISLQTPANTTTQNLQQHQSQNLQQPQSQFTPPFQTYHQTPPYMFPSQSLRTPYQPHMHSSFSVHQINQHPQGRRYIPSVDSCLPIPKFLNSNIMTSPHGQYNVVTTQNMNNQPLVSSKQPENYNVSNDQYFEGSRSHHWGKTSAMPALSSTPKALPRALPMAVSVNEVSNSGGTERSVSVEDIVENAVAMGFRRDVVKATVKKLTENEQTVDLNVVLDKLINS